MSAGVGMPVAAAVSGRALGKASRMFDQSPSTIMSELIQNARRAGATLVKVTTRKRGSRTEVTVEDDGGGIADMQALVTFGRSDWSEQVRQQEDVGGLGVFCLAAYGCDVTSRGMAVRLEPATFRGEAEAVVKETTEAPGTTVSFSVPNQRRTWNPFARDPFVEAAEDEARHAPIRVVVNGEPVTQAKFTENHVVLIELADATVAIDIDGRVDDPRRDQDRLSVNFFGHKARAPAVPLGKTTTGVVRGRWDVKPGSRLRLVLPTRDRVVEDEAWHEVVAQTKLLATQALLADGRHDPAMEDVEACRAAGMDLPDPRVRLVEWTLRHGYRQATVKDLVEVADPGQAILIDDDLSPRAIVAAAALAKAAKAAGQTLFVAHDGIEGHPLADRIPKLRSIQRTVVMLDGRSETEEVYHDEWMDMDMMFCFEVDPPRMVRSVTYEAAFESATGIKETVVADAGFGIDPTDGEGDEDRAFVPVVATSAVRNATLFDEAVAAISTATYGMMARDEASLSLDGWRRLVRDTVVAAQPAGRDAMFQALADAVAMSFHDEGVPRMMRGIRRAELRTKPVRDITVEALDGRLHDVPGYVVGYQE